MLENLKQKFLFWLHDRIEQKLDIKRVTGITADEAMDIFDNRMRAMEANFDEKMIATIEIMIETKLDIFNKVNDLVIANESWITNYYFKNKNGENDDG